MLERSSGGIYWGEHDDAELAQMATSILVFFRDYLIGPGYSALAVPENDEWQKVLVELELAVSTGRGRRG